MPNTHIVLEGISPPLVGLEWQAEKALRIGRTPSMDVILDDRSISRRHAEIVLGADGWAIVDLGSSNGTYVNGVRIGRALHTVRQYDRLQFGSLCLTVKSLSGAAVAPKPTASDIRTTQSVVRLQAATQNPWQYAVRSLSDIADHRPEGDKGFLALIRAGHHLSHVSSLERLLDSVLDEAVSALGAQRGAILLIDEAVDELQLRASAVPRPFPSSGRPFSRTLSMRCFQEQQSILCVDPRNQADIATASVRHGTMASVICALLRTPRKQLGVLHLDRGPLQEPFTEEDLYLADAIAASVSTGIECARLVEHHQEQSLQMVTALARAVELRDQYTAGHTQRVTTYAMLLARELGFSQHDQRQIQVGTPLHDLGKIGVRDYILLKAGRLSADEFEHVKLHTIKGAEILETMPDLAGLIPIVRSHHERWDGRGYPDGLAGKEISRLARVVAVADAFDAMTSDRPYRDALTIEGAFAELESHAGGHFDPECIAAFRRLQPEIENVLAQEKCQSVASRAFADTVTAQQLLTLTS